VYVNSNIIKFCTHIWSYFLWITAFRNWPSTWLRVGVYCIALSLIITVQNVAISLLLSC